MFRLEIADKATLHAIQANHKPANRSVVVPKDFDFPAFPVSDSATISALMDDEPSRRVFPEFERSHYTHSKIRATISSNVVSFCIVFPLRIMLSVRIGEMLQVTGHFFEI